MPDPCSACGCSRSSAGCAVSIRSEHASSEPPDRPGVDADPQHSIDAFDHGTNPHVVVPDTHATSGKEFLGGDISELC